MPFNSETARAAGLKSQANRTPEVRAAVAAARWGEGYVAKNQRPVELPAGPVRQYWVDEVARRYPDEFSTMSQQALIRRATLLARQAAAEAVAGRPAQASTNDAFALLRARLCARREAGAGDE